jgi:hypothetical protein
MTAPSLKTQVATRQSCLSQCAQAQSQGVVQRIHSAPMQAIQTHAALNTMAVLDWLHH